MVSLVSCEAFTLKSNLLKNNLSRTRNWFYLYLKIWHNADSGPVRMCWPSSSCSLTDSAFVTASISAFWNNSVRLNVWLDPGVSVDSAACLPSLLCPVLCPTGSEQCLCVDSTDMSWCSGYSSQDSCTLCMIKISTSDRRQLYIITTFVLFLFWTI